ncbi:MAG: hypothetical protein ACE5EK_02285 [Nitrospinales bacterium]
MRKFSVRSNRKHSYKFFSILILSLLVFFLQMYAMENFGGNVLAGETKEHQLTPPSGNWEIYKDAWAHKRDFGFATYLERETMHYSGDLEPIFNPSKLKEKILFDIETGFRHKTQNMRILVATIDEGKLIEYLESKTNKNIRGSGNNLISVYLDGFGGTYQTKTRTPAIRATRNFPALGEVGFLRTIVGSTSWAIYGAQFGKQYVFVALQADPGAPESVIAEGLKALEETMGKVPSTGFPNVGRFYMPPPSKG